MSITPSAPGPDFAAFQPGPVPPQPDPAEMLRKRVYMGFAGIVAVGLAVAGLYIGGRLFARPKPLPQPLVAATVAHSAPQPVAPKPSPLQAAVPVRAEAAAKPAPAQNAPVLNAPVPNAPAQGLPALIDPKAGERYLQLAALPPDYTTRYVKELEAKGIQASVAPGPSENVFRVVLGPFADRSDLVRQREILDAAGIQSMERIY